jgi:hypothetical protein
MLNSNTDSQVFGPPERRVAPAGNHMGKMLGLVSRFAQVKSRVAQPLVQFELHQAVTLIGNPSIEFITRFPLTKNKEME